MVQVIEMEEGASSKGEKSPEEGEVDAQERPRTLSGDMTEVCSTLGIKRSAKKKMIEMGRFTTVDETVDAIDLIKKEYPEGLSIDTRAKLMVLVKWKLNEKHTTLEKFHELTDKEIDTLVEIEKGILQNPSEMDSDMVHILLEARITDSDRNILAGKRIRCPNDLIRIEDELKTADNLQRFMEGGMVSDLQKVSNLGENKWSDLTSSTPRRLLQIINWLKRYPAADIRKDFNSTHFEQTTKRLFDIEASDMALGKGYTHLRVFKELQNRNNEDPTKKKEVKKLFKKRVLTPKLKERNKNFSKDKFLDGIADVLYDYFGCDMPREEWRSRVMCVYGPPQSQKSCVVALVQSAGAKCGFPVFVNANGNKQCRDIWQKLMEFSGEIGQKPNEIVIVPCSDDNVFTKKEKEEMIKLALTSGTGTIIFADTPKQTNDMAKWAEFYATEHPYGRSIVVVDEADSLMFRTDDGELVIEQAFQNFCDKLKPTIIILVTATPVPLYIDMKRIKKRFNCVGESDIFCIDPKGNYNSITNGGIKPFTQEGETVYLTKGELTKGKPYRGMPYANKILVDFCKDALKPRSLFLCCTCPWVNVDDENVFILAAQVQNLMKNDPYQDQDTGKDVIVITFTGEFKVCVKYSHDKCWDKSTWCDQHIGALLEYIDKEFGMEIPVFIFGTYHTMDRCYSFRSARRVPTHLAMSLGKDHKDDRVVQMIGRMMGFIKEELMANGFSHAKILTTKNDFEKVTYYFKFLDAVHKYLATGISLDEAICLADKDAPWLFRSDRELGKIPQQKKRALMKYSCENFESSSSVSSNSSETISHDNIPKKNPTVSASRNDKTFYQIKNNRRIIRSIERLRKNEVNEVFAKNIMEDLADQEDLGDMDEEDVAAELEQLCEHGLIEKTVYENGKQWYRKLFMESTIITKKGITDEGDPVGSEDSYSDKDLPLGSNLQSSTWGRIRTKKGVTDNEEFIESEESDSEEDLPCSSLSRRWSFAHKRFKSCK